MNNFQRIGSVSNAHIGREFEEFAQQYFAKQNIILNTSYSLPVGVREQKKEHTFDLGSSTEKMIIECKAHTWTSGTNVPSAKITVWNEAMYYFFLAPKEYRKIFFIQKDFSEKRQLTLGEYYIRNYKHLIPNDVEIMEYDVANHTVSVLNLGVNC
jgi:hypothetical protein